MAGGRSVVEGAKPAVAARDVKYLEEVRGQGDIKVRRGAGNLRISLFVWKKCGVDCIEFSRSNDKQSAECCRCYFCEPFWSQRRRIGNRNLHFPAVRILNATDSLLKLGGTPQGLHQFGGRRLSSRPQPLPEVGRHDENEADPGKD